MQDKIQTLFDYVKSLPVADLDRIIDFVLGIVASNQQPSEKPACPHCAGIHIVKFGHRNGKQRFLCRNCTRTFMHTTNTLMEGSHYTRSTWADFIRDTLFGHALDWSAKKYHFSHQTAFNMRHKVLMALQDMLDSDPVLLSGVAELDETFVLDCFKGASVPQSAGRKARKHGAKASKRGISSEYVAICTGIQRDGGIVAATVNRAKPSSQEVSDIFRGHIADDTLVLTDGLQSYHALESLSACKVINVNHEQDNKMFHLNTVNSLHSYIKDTYNFYRAVATKYINRYNALFAVAFRCSDVRRDTLFACLCSSGQGNRWHGVKDISRYHLVAV